MRVNRFEKLLEVPSFDGLATQIQSNAVRGEWARFLHTSEAFAVEHMPKIWLKSSRLQQLVICRFCKPRDLSRCMLQFIGDRDLSSSSSSSGDAGAYAGGPVGGVEEEGKIDKDPGSSNSKGADLCFARHARPFSFIETLYDHARGLSTGVPFLLYSKSIGFDVVREVEELARALGHAPMTTISASGPVCEILDVLQDAGERGKWVIMRNLECMDIRDQELVRQFLRRAQVEQEVSDGTRLRFGYRLFITAELESMGDWEVLRPWALVCRALCCEWLNASVTALERRAANLPSQSGTTNAAVVDVSIRELSGALLLHSRVDERIAVGDRKPDPMRHMRRLDFICASQRIKGSDVARFCAYSFALQGGRLLPYLFARCKGVVRAVNQRSIASDAEVAFGAEILPQQSLDIEHAGKEKENEGQRTGLLVAREVDAYSLVLRSSWVARVGACSAHSFTIQANRALPSPPPLPPPPLS